MQSLPFLSFSKGSGPRGEVARRPETRRLFGRSGDGRSVQSEFDRDRVLEDVEHWAVRVYDRLELLEFGGRRGTLQRDCSADAREARTYVVADREESAQIEVALKADGHAVERNPERRRIGAVGDFLTGGESRENQLDRVRSGVRAAEGRRLVDRYGELSYPRFAAHPFDLPRVGGKDRCCRLGVDAKGR